MNQGVASKIVAESLLSLYPVFVKNIDVSLNLQMWSRFFTYVVLAGFFMDYDFVKSKLFSKDGLLLAAVTIVHIYTSYMGFLKLPSGPAYTMFYIYPVFILIFSGFTFPPYALLAAAGVWFLSSTSELDQFAYEGVFMIMLAALTEAIIYFIIKRIKTTNNWDHVFLSYFWGAIGMTFYFLSTQEPFTPALTTSVGINGIIGLGGYVLRFFSMTHLDVYWYALLSNVGMVMSYVYGYAFNGEVVGLTQIFGTSCIWLACALARR
jgi:drug/metabolite transporter (DMT)-like permease